MDLKARLTSMEVRHGFRQSPVLDQFFVTDSGVLERVVRHADISASDVVLEIGPGSGFMTELLAQKAGKVLAVEIDKRLEPLLKAEYSQYLNIDFLFEDFLLASLPKFDKCVSNIPYSASAPITFKLLDYEFDSAILMYQKEFAEKMVAEPGDYEYGRLSVMIKYYYDARILEIVNKSAFTPMPKVDSAVVRLKKRDVVRDPDFDVMVRELFRYQNKDVHNAFKHAFNIDVADNRKVHTLEIEELIALKDHMKRKA